MGTHVHGVVAMSPNTGAGSVGQFDRLAAHATPRAWVDVAFEVRVSSDSEGSEHDELIVTDELIRGFDRLVYIVIHGEIARTPRP